MAAVSPAHPDPIITTSCIVSTFPESACLASGETSYSKGKTSYNPFHDAMANLLLQFAPRVTPFRAVPGRSIHPFDATEDLLMRGVCCFDESKVASVPQ